MSDRLFVPLKTKHYRNFESGDKDIELRGLNNQFNPTTVYPGRRVELRRGYSTGDSLWGKITETHYFKSIQQLTSSIDYQRILPGATREEFIESVNKLLSKYDRYVAFAITIDS